MPTKKQLQEQLDEIKKENEKLREENELKKDAWCPELILKDLYVNTNYKDPSLTIKEYIQKIEAENKKLKEEKKKDANEFIFLKKILEDEREEENEWRKIDGADGLMQDLFYDGYTKTKLVCGIHSEVDNVVQGIKDMKEKIDELKKQLSAKKGKRLSQKDKEILEDLEFNANANYVNGLPDHHRALLARLLK